MAKLFPRSPKPLGKSPAGDEADDRMPSNAELLHELRLHGVKPRRPREIPTVSRRTRDYLMVAGIGSGIIVGGCFRLMNGSDVLVVARLALTGVALLCGLLWFIFYGVMSRY